MEELKDCPKPNCDGVGLVYEGDNEFMVFCGSCLWRGVVTETDWFPTEQQAIQAWNTRA